MRRARLVPVWLLLAAVLIFLYAPLIPPIILAFQNPVTGAPTLANLAAIPADATLVGALLNSVLLAAIVAIVAPLLALAAAQAVRRFRLARLIVTVMLLPLFVPGISMGVSTSLFFNLAGVDPSLLTMATVQTLWALPFAFLVVLTAMSSFDPLYLEAAYTSGANQAQAFLEVELPQIAPGLTGAATFSAILSFNETIRTSVVQGGHNTVQTLIWSRYQQVGLTPSMHALMSLIIGLTLLLILALVLLERKQGV